MSGKKSVYYDSIHFDVVIVGSGFAGSLAALMLHQSGFSTCLIEKEKHPRFAIGESSTPVADMILRKLADDYRLPWLKNFSRYGLWQKHFPEITCGIKRGFSYYLQEKKHPFRSNHHHCHELLVAASKNNVNSDTNWYRPDFDAFLAEKVKESGITCYENTTVTGCRKTGRDTWLMDLSAPAEKLRIECPLMIDATGSPAFSKKFLHVESGTDGFETNSMAIFSHFKNVGTWSGYLRSHNFYTGDYPYTPDHSALHHLLEEGWMWMLRFNNDLVSAGVVVDRTIRMPETVLKPEALWVHYLEKYPSLSKLFSDSRPAPLPGRFIRTGRLQRRVNQLAGPGWVALNHTAGFVDPLHSTGIAHSLAGLEKVIPVLIETRHQPAKRDIQLAIHQSAFFKEIRLIDLLVAGCYRCRRIFPLFSAYSMLYFICSIQYEQQRLNGTIPTHFLSADNNELTTIVEDSFQDLRTLLAGVCNVESIRNYSDRLGKRILPWNHAGLMDSKKNNMYKHTAVRL